MNLKEALYAQKFLNFAKIFIKFALIFVVVMDIVEMEFASVFLIGQEKTVEILNNEI